MEEFVMSATGDVILYSVHLQNTSCFETETYKNAQTLKKTGCETSDKSIRLSCQGDDVLVVDTVEVGQSNNSNGINYLCGFEFNSVCNIQEVKNDNVIKDMCDKQNECIVHYDDYSVLRQNTCDEDHNVTAVITYRCIRKGNMNPLNITSKLAPVVTDVYQYETCTNISPTSLTFHMGAYFRIDELIINFNATTTAAPYQFNITVHDSADQHSLCIGDAQIKHSIPALYKCQYLEFGDQVEIQSIQSDVYTDWKICNVEIYATPACRPISEIEHGIILNSTSWITSFTCDERFGNTTSEIHCINHTWSQTPSCTLVNCKEPPTMEHGSRNYTSTRVESLADYTCDDGFQIPNITSLQCSSNDSWVPYGNYSNVTFIFWTNHQPVCHPTPTTIGTNPTTETIGTIPSTTETIPTSVDTPTSYPNQTIQPEFQSSPNTTMPKTTPLMIVFKDIAEEAEKADEYVYIKKIEYEPSEAKYAAAIAIPVCVPPIIFISMIIILDLPKLIMDIRQAYNLVVYGTKKKPKIGPKAPILKPNKS
ncbi:unnamed protein product [Owenia fusiformis]|uniref:Uncharacterized protein n=1 Tax=Owenia fusiformis TaxID=6347 RepID=A0A8J1Y6A1_OWEFU|nr:unnamed protein product [Owenia fusiformis]